MEIDFTQSEIDTIKKHVDSRWREQKHGVHMGDIEVGGVEKPAASFFIGWFTHRNNLQNKNHFSTAHGVVAINGN
jgi:hypothetical protein